MNGTAPRRGLREALASGRFVVTAELSPPRGPNSRQLQDKVASLRDWVDAVNVTDNQGAVVRMSSLAGSLLAMRAGVEPIMQLTTRDRNRLALQSELLSAAALSIPNVLLLTGDHPTFGDHPDGKPVFDVDSIQLVWMARMMRDHGRLLSGKKVDPAPDFLIGAVENPTAPPGRFRARRLGKKVSAGAEFAQTQYVFDVCAFEGWMQDVRDLDLHRRCKILAGVGPILTPRALEHMRTRIPGVSVPDPVAKRLLSAPAGRFAEEGVRLAAETIERVREIDGVAGVHVMAFGNERRVPDILEQAGIREGMSGRAG